MNIKVLKNDSGIVSGVVIPTEDLHEVKESIKRDSELFQVITDPLNDRQSSPLSETVLSHGKTIAETEADALVLTRALYANAFRKGVPMFYRDKRVQHANEFVRSNPDGSEDLVSFEASTRIIHIDQKFGACNLGKGKIINELVHKMNLLSQASYPG